MKIRLSFVPNSSSSSFILAFPKKPKTERDMYSMLFGNYPEDEKIYDYGDLTRLEAAKILFRDVTSKEARATKKKLLENLADRYVYFASTWNNADGFYQKAYSDLCWGTDPELVEKIRKLHEEEELVSKHYREVTQKYMDDHVAPVPYASDCKNSQGKRAYTKKQVKDFEAYCKKADAIRKSPEYKKLDKEEWDKRQKIWDAIRKLERELAEKDLQALLEKTKGKYMAVLSYSDNDGSQGGAMEHGDIYRNIICIRISHH
jgi:hypothetical protein